MISSDFQSKKTSFSVFFSHFAIYCERESNQLVSKPVEAQARLKFTQDVWFSFVFLTFSLREGMGNFIHTPPLANDSIM